LGKKDSLTDNTEEKKLTPNADIPVTRKKKAKKAGAKKEPDPKKLEEKERKKKERAKARELRKKARLQRKLERKTPPALYEPEKQDAFAWSVPIGYAMRFFSIGFSVFGVCYLVCDAFKLKVSALYLLFLCVYMVSAFSTIFLGHKKLALAGAGAVVLYFGAAAIFSGNIAAYYVGGLSHLQDMVISRLSGAGFTTGRWFNFPSLGGVAGDANAVLATGGISVIAIILCIIFAAFSAKRTRLLPMLICGGGLCVVVFTYNITNSNFGIACVLAGLCATIVLSCYDKLYKNIEKNKKSRAYSGYSAFLASILATLVLILPAANMKKSFTEIEAISTRMEYARAIVTTILTGGDPRLNKMNMSMTKVDVSIDEITLYEADLFEITSYTSYNTYLRSWIGKEYSDSTWYMPGEDELDSLRKLLGGGYVDEDFTGDEFTANFYKLFDGEVANLPEYSSAANYSYGYVASYVDVEYVENSGQLFVFPSSYLAGNGLLEFRSRNEAYKGRFDYFADGIFQSTLFNPFKKYTVGAVIPNYLNKNFANNLEARLNFLECLKETINSITYGGYDKETAKSIFAENLAMYDLAGVDTWAIEDYMNQPSSQRQRWLTKNLENPTKYYNYLLENYMSYPRESAGINETLALLEDKLDEAQNTYEKLMVVVNYLNENFKYSTNPTKPSGSVGDGGMLDGFLLETKEGWCQQFATAATLLYRAIGIPARYAQGYIATDFERDKDEKGNSCYKSIVNDVNSHAWVEVYVDGIGWMTLEVTPRFYNAMYYVPSEDDLPRPESSDITLPAPITTEPIITTAPAITEPTDEPEEEQRIDVKALLKVALVLAVIGFAIYLIVKRIVTARRTKYNREAYAEIAQYGGYASEELPNIANIIVDCIYEIEGAAGFKPYTGELPSEFARRVDTLEDFDPEKRSTQKYLRLREQLPCSFSEVMTLIEKSEFGGTLSRDELALLGAYLSALCEIEYKRMNIFKRLVYRYLFYMI